MCQAVRELGGTAIALGLHNGYDLTIRVLKPKYLRVSPHVFLVEFFAEFYKEKRDAAETLGTIERTKQALDHQVCSFARNPT